MSLEERVYLEALLNTCAEDVTSRLEAMNEGKLELPELIKVPKPMKKQVFKNSIKNVTRQEQNISVRFFF